MNKTVRFTLLLIICTGILSATVKPVRALSPYNTWTIGPGGYPVITQNAYEPFAEIDLPANGPEDMIVTSDGLIYIADTGNGQILKLKDFEVVSTYGDGILESPTGVFVDEDGVMYIADAKKNEIIILDKDGNLINEFGRPTEPLFGKNREFLPRKIAVDARKNLYIISEGSVNGVVQMNTNGSFIGYFGANSSAMSLEMILQRTFLTQEQLSQFVKNEAASPSNLTIDNQSLVYTITAGTDSRQAIRRFTIAGKNIFPDTWGSSTFRDIKASNNGLVLAVDSNGQIYEYDQNGMLLFLFGAKDTSAQRLGTLLSPVAIERFGEYVYVLDKDKNTIVVYQTTAFGQKVHEGVRLYMDGYYVEAQPYFEEVLDFNGLFILSYRAIGDAYFKQGNYQQALAAYRYGEDRSGYSEAFWELRNVVIQKNLSQALGWILGLTIVFNLSSRLDRRYRWFEPVRQWLKNLRHFRLIDDFVFMFRFIKAPADSFYYIKMKERGSLRFALIIYAWVIIVRVAELYLTGFIFNPDILEASWMIEETVLITVGAIFLWNAANYLISTISDGEGRVRDVVIGSAYSLFPIVLFALPIALISNVLTENEAFLYSFSLNVMWAWTAIMLFTMVKEIHNYTFSETVRNVLITLFTVALFVLTGYILYILFYQLYDFVSAIIQEVGLRD